MLTRTIVFAIGCLASAWCGAAAAADGHFGPQHVEATACHVCTSHHCVLVPETRQIKKTVYEIHEVPYCLKKLPPLFSFHKHCDDCAECDCVRYKRVLVKKEIVCDEVCTMKCIPQPCK